MHKPEGSHIIVELSGGDYSQLNDKKLLMKLIADMVQVAGAKAVGSPVAHNYKPQGVSIIQLIEESHIAIHTYPEWGYAAIDIFTCGEDQSTLSALVAIEKTLRHQYLEINKIWRGLSK